VIFCTVIGTIDSFHLTIGLLWAGTQQFMPRSSALADDNRIAPRGLRIRCCSADWYFSSSIVA
jgi:hypothetical protein